jgi:uncharacterized membrane-anchored protein
MATNPMEQFEVKTIGPKIVLGNLDISFTNSALFMVIVVALITIFFYCFYTKEVPNTWQITIVSRDDI